MKALERSTASEQAVDAHLQDADVIEGEVLELSETKFKRGINTWKIAAHELGDAQRGREAERGRRQRAQWSSTFEKEHLEFI